MPSKIATAIFSIGSAQRRNRIKSTRQPIVKFPQLKSTCNIRQLIWYKIKFRQIVFHFNLIFRANLEANISQISCILFFLQIYSVSNKVVNSSFQYNISKLCTHLQLYLRHLINQPTITSNYRQLNLRQEHNLNIHL